MDLKLVNSREQPERFAFGDFAGREQRRTARLVRAAYGVGHGHSWFVALPKAEQETKVREWVEDALEDRAIRLGHIADLRGFPSWVNA